ncbi:hypothetical protein Glove_19g345 [Diversispora epigaea]|uniref:DNA helicase n=1 Tax=Diversispora epigaea TaxID=1348612 RepID=A0A397JSN2_9GLOM|nr:hypothetical protein Glove_19g345 [Diversispora epigaea]
MLIEKKYGRNVITPNLHLSFHLSACSHDFGPLYAFWCFSFERMNGILGSLPNSHRTIEPELMCRLINDNRINEIIYTENNSKGLKILNTRQSIESLLEMDQFGYDEMRRFWMYSRTIQESTISEKEPFPGEMLKPFSENIPLSADGILDLMIAYYNDTYENLKFWKPFETDSLNSIIISLKINKYCRCRIGSKIFGSTFSSRYQKSSYILAKFAFEDDNIDIYPVHHILGQFVPVKYKISDRKNAKEYLAYDVDGTGKSKVIQAIKSYFEYTLQYETLLILVPTGNVITNINGHTIYSTCDEISMVGQMLLAEFYSFLKKIKGTDNLVLFARINILFAGNFMQLPPVLDLTLYIPDKINSLTVMNTAGRNLWLNVKHVICLKKPMRQINDPFFADILENEISMVGQMLLAEFYSFLKKIKGTDNLVLFARINILFAGNFMQLPPVLDLTLYIPDKINSLTVMNTAGRNLWLNVKHYTQQNLSEKQKSVIQSRILNDDQINIPE